ncbi:MAG TPA: DUF3299 domain-containing protein [Planctomycetota bacterium]|nr:DUF3299 domain-containing protein [Planctomycetota bacterium]
MEMRPTWIAVAIITCVVFGSTMNKCLCGRPVAEEAAAQPVAVNEGTPFVEEKGPGEGGEARMPEARPTEPAAEAKPAGLEDHEDLTFDKLASYKYEVHELVEGVPPVDQIPVSIKALHGKKVAIKGFMLPYKNDGENVTEFILLRNQGLCCFGTVPRMNEWVHVKMAPGRGAPYAIDVPLTVFGTLEVGEEYEKNVLMSLYRMESTTVIVPPVFR